MERKKIVYWGIGEICKNCLLERPDVVPNFYIDSYSKSDTFNGKKVYAPHEVINWKDLYTVITIKKYEDIVIYLIEKGLVQGKDFDVYTDFFDIKKVLPKDSINDTREYRKNNKKSKKTTIMFVPIFIGRQANQLQRFFSSYVKHWKKNKECIIYTSKGIVTDIDAESRMGCKVFQDILNQCESNNDNRLTIEISSKKEKQLIEIVNRKNTSNHNMALQRAKELYVYYYELINVLQADEVLIWGNWDINSYIINMVVDELGIDYRFLEHGCIPGTIQSDAHGIAGQSEYAVNDLKFSKIEISKDDIDKAKTVIKFVKQKKMDTRSFVETQWDSMQLAKLKSNKKTVLLVGNDEIGMKMNPESCYWDNYISSNYKSMRSIIDELIPICKEKKLNLVFKPHPGNRYNDLMDNEYIVYVENKDISTLIDISDVVVSMPSAVEYTALIREKPLIQLGKSTLNYAGCTYLVGETLSLEDAIDLALYQQFTDIQKNRFIELVAKLLNDHLWDDMSERDIRYGQLIEQDFFKIKW